MARAVGSQDMGLITDDELQFKLQQWLQYGRRFCQSSKISKRVQPRRELLFGGGEDEDPDYNTPAPKKKKRPHVGQFRTCSLESKGKRFSEGYIQGFNKNQPRG